MAARANSLFSNRLERLAAGAGLAGTAAALSKPVSDPELFRYLSAGRPWIGAEWLPAALWQGAYSAAGFAGLWSLKTAALAACAALLWKVLGLYGARAGPRALALLAWTAGIGPANDLRPGSLSLFFLLALWGYWEARRLGRLEDPGGPAEAAGHAALFAFWANCHGAFLAGLGLLGLFAALRCLETRSPRAAAVLICAALGALLNPEGPAVYAAALEAWRALGELELIVPDWRESPALDFGLGPFWLIFAAALGALLLNWVTRGAPRAEHLAALLILGIAAARRTGAAAFFVTAAIPVAASALRRLRPRWLKRVLLALALPAALLHLAVSGGGILRPPRAFDFDRLPRGAADYLDRERSSLAPLRAYASRHWRAYLGWRLPPDYRLFDGERPPARERPALQQDAVRDPQSFARYLDDRFIDLLALERGTLVHRLPIALRGGRTVFHMRPFYLSFLPEENWALLYWDEQGYVFVRRRAFDAFWLAEREFRHFRPDDLLAAQLRLRDGLIAFSELEREVERFRAGAPTPELADGARRWLEEAGALRPELEGD